jgi:hypothetical protein
MNVRRGPQTPGTVFEASGTPCSQRSGLSRRSAREDERRGNVTDFHSCASSPQMSVERFTGMIGIGTKSPLDTRIVSRRTPLRSRYGALTGISSSRTATREVPVTGAYRRIDSRTTASSSGSLSSAATSSCASGSESHALVGSGSARSSSRRRVWMSGRCESAQRIQERPVEVVSCPASRKVGISG